MEKKLLWINLLLMVLGAIIALAARIASPVEIPNNIYFWIRIGEGLFGAGSYAIILGLIMGRVKK